MLLDKGESIFDKMKLSYNKISTSDNPIKPIREYYRSNLRGGESLWWIDGNLGDQPVLAPQIRDYSSLDKESKNRIEAEIFVRFPIVLSNKNRVKYNDIPAYLVSMHGVVSPNLRDHFTAGGQVNVLFKGQEHRVPRIVCKLINSKGLIIALFSQELDLNFDNWLNKIDEYVEYLNLNFKLSDVFKQND